MIYKVVDTKFEHKMVTNPSKLSESLSNDVWLSAALFSRMTWCHSTRWCGANPLHCCHAVLMTFDRLRHVDCKRRINIPEYSTVSYSSYADTFWCISSTCGQRKAYDAADEIQHFFRKKHLVLPCRWLIRLNLFLDWTGTMGNVCIVHSWEIQFLIKYRNDKPNGMRMLKGC